MKQTRSLFRRFLKGHFLFIFFPPMMLIFFVSFISVSDINEEDLNTLNPFFVIILLFGFIIVAFVVISWLFFLRLRKRLTRL
ncbi:type IV secretory pathway TrbL component, partial [Bacillus chungangensis]|nr:type IV secretory pathway TrbL component [Bacillus chungangensis]